MSDIHSHNDSLTHVSVCLSVCITVCVYLSVCLSGAGSSAEEMDT